MSPNINEIPNDENENPFVNLETLLVEKVSIGALAQEIKVNGIYTWDRFGVYGLADNTGEEEALEYLALQYEWLMIPEDEKNYDNSRSPLEQLEGLGISPFEKYGWAKKVLPSFKLQSGISNKGKTRVSISEQQESEILNWLKKRGHSPLQLPKAPNGKPGIKKECGDAVCKNRSLFSSRSVFETAWERLRKNKEIQDAKR